MASGKDLTRLATLAGMAYIANKMGDKGETPKGKTDTGPGYTSTETRVPAEAPTADEDTKSDVLKAITAKREAPNDQAESEGVIGASTTKPAKLKRAAPAKQTSSSSDRRDMESGTSRGTRGADASKAYPSGVMGGARQPNAKPSTSTAPSTTKTTAPTSSPAKQSLSADFTPGKVPTPEQAAANRQAAYDKVKSVGSSVVDYVKNFETPAERRSREAKEAKTAPAKPASTREFDEDALSTGSAMRRGGAVKKMASGGMTASKRADGIASRGKTKCKMY